MNQTKLILLAVVAVCLAGCGSSGATEPASGTKAGSTTAVPVAKPDLGNKSAAPKAATLGPGAADVDSRIGSKATK